MELLQRKERKYVETRFLTVEALSLGNTIFLTFDFESLLQPMVVSIKSSLCAELDLKQNLRAYMISHSRW